MLAADNTSASGLRGLPDRRDKHRRRTTGSGRQVQPASSSPVRLGRAADAWCPPEAGRDRTARDAVVGGSHSIHCLSRTCSLPIGVGRRDTYT